MRLSMLLPLLLVRFVAPVEALCAESQAGRDRTKSGHYEVGAGDVLEITHSGETQILTVQLDGKISIPTGKLEARGLTASEISRKVAAQLEEIGLSTVRPTVRVKEYRSRSAFVTGEVRRPGRYYLVGNQTVFDILLQAGGFTSHASGEVVVHPIDGRDIIRIDLSPDMAMREQRHALSIRLANGDAISVTRRLPALDSGPVP